MTTSFFPNDRVSLQLWGEGRCQLSVRCIPRGVQVWYHLSEAEMQTTGLIALPTQRRPSQTSILSIGAIKKNCPMIHILLIQHDSAVLLSAGHRSISHATHTYLFGKQIYIVLLPGTHVVYKWLVKVFDCKFYFKPCFKDLKQHYKAGVKPIV